MQFKRQIAPNTDNLVPLQMKMLEILKYFIRFCEEHSLAWYAAYGTLLGAVRNKGFIPWDSDIDIIMPRADYERFISLSDKIEYPYIVQSFALTSGYTSYCSHLADTNTTFITKQVMLKNPIYELPISIDIFALDTCDSYESMNDMLNRIKHIRRPIMQKKWNGDYNNILEYQKDAMKSICKVLEENKSDKYVFEITDELHKDRDDKLYTTNCYNSIIQKRFWDISVNVPCGYDMILSRSYGNWRVPDRSKIDHSLYFYDTEKPSSFYVA